MGSREIFPYAPYFVTQRVFNHQTHHRGQIHDMLTQTEIAPPSLDMHRVISA
ncbi:DinB family protein [Nostoc sp.]|uniref:DinB family protein n=2 Tax=Nostoc TaxID=1177 RepID=UPI002FFA6F95